VTVIASADAVPAALKAADRLAEAGIEAAQEAPLSAEQQFCSLTIRAQRQGRQSAL
jgi:hypothetical protein